ncbi:MAG: hypothetical protein AAGB26_04080 [Planctomycetota bacterium]
MATKRRRIPKLCYSPKRGLGYHVNYRDPETGIAKKHKFGMVSESEARAQYHQWVAASLNGDTPTSTPDSPPPQEPEETPPPTRKALVVEGCLAIVAGSFLRQEEFRVWDGTGTKARGMISANVYADRKGHLGQFLEFLNEQHGHGAVGSMQLADLTLTDIEKYNRKLAQKGMSESAVSKRMQIVKRLIDHAGRPEFGLQTLTWNWDSRQTYHGKPTNARKLPTVKQLQQILSRCGPRETAIVWMAIGLGFGQGDLAVIRTNQIDQKGYDLRRGKTKVERYGDTPKLIWDCVQRYLEAVPRPKDDLLFVTRNGLPIVRRQSDSVLLWWQRTRTSLGYDKQSLGGFYTLRHLGATEFGSRPGASLNEVRGWLGHAAGSAMADVYMKPVSPEYREVVEWVRNALQTGEVDLTSHTS